MRKVVTMFYSSMLLNFPFFSPGRDGKLTTDPLFGSGLSGLGIGVREQIKLNEYEGEGNENSHT